MWLELASTNWHSCGRSSSSREVLSSVLPAARFICKDPEGEIEKLLETVEEATGEQALATIN